MPGYKPNKVKIALREKRMVLGTAAQIASPEVVEIIGNQGFDFVWIDMEHGHFGVESMVSMVRAADTCSLVPMVRVLHNEPSYIMQVLDAGAMGVIVPGISTREEAEKAVQAAKYYPLGSRGSCPWTRATGYCAKDWNKHTQWSNEETILWLLIEGKEGIENLEEILRVPGVDIVLLGTVDLAQSLGIPGQIDHPMVKKALSQMIDIAQAQNVSLAKVTVAETDADAIAASVAEWRDIGGQVICLGGDRPLLSNILSNTLKAAQREC